MSLRCTLKVSFPKTSPRLLEFRGSSLVPGFEPFDLQFLRLFHLAPLPPPPPTCRPATL